MSDERTIEARIYERLSKVIDPELGRSVTDLGMIAAIDATPVAGETNTYDVRVRVELTVEGCPLSQTITNQINGAVASYPDATLIPSIEVGSMSQDKLTQLLAGQQEIKLGSLTPTRDFNYVKDTAHGFMAIADCVAAIGQ